MGLPSLKRVSFEDYPGAPDWFRSFLEVLNPFLNDVTTQAATQTRQYATLTVETAATLDDTFANSRIRVKNRLGSKPMEVRVARVTPKSSGDSITSAVGVVWDLLGTGEIRILGLPGLNTSKTYEVVLAIE